MIASRAVKESAAFRPGDLRMATRTIDLAAPRGLRLQAVVFSHGWLELPPFEWLADERTLRYVIRVGSKPVSLGISQPGRSGLSVAVETSGRWSLRIGRSVESTVPRILGFGVDLGKFHKVAGEDYHWARRRGAGRLLRSSTAFEDAVKMLATTNCSWSLTRQMIGRLVQSLGEPAPCGTKAFPTAAAMAARSEEFFRRQVRVGYRAPFFKSLADTVADGSLDPESWVDFAGDAHELARDIMQVRGFGRYAAENLCRVFGRFDFLALDSWCLKKYAQIHGPIRGDVETDIRRSYERFGPWKGMALWLDLTRDWHETNKALVRADGKAPSAE